MKVRLVFFVCSMLTVLALPSVRAEVILAPKAESFAAPAAWFEKACWNDSLSGKLRLGVACMSSGELHRAPFADVESSLSTEGGLLMTSSWESAPADPGVWLRAAPVTGGEAMIAAVIPWQANPFGAEVEVNRPAATHISLRRILGNLWFFSFLQDRAAPSGGFFN